MIYSSEVTRGQKVIRNCSSPKISTFRPIQAKHLLMMCKFFNQQLGSYKWIPGKFLKKLQSPWSYIFSQNITIEKRQKWKNSDILPYLRKTWKRIDANGWNLSYHAYRLIITLTQTEKQYLCITSQKKQNALLITTYKNIGIDKKVLMSIPFGSNSYH